MRSRRRFIWRWRVSSPLPYGCSDARSLSARRKSAGLPPSWRHDGAQRFRPCAGRSRVGGRPPNGGVSSCGVALPRHRLPPEFTRGPLSARLEAVPFIFFPWEIPSMLRRSVRAAGALSIGALLLFLTAAPAFAHEQRTVGSFQITVGWLHEPSYAGIENAVQLT